jgi:hypothetical protein
MQKSEGKNSVHGNLVATSVEFFVHCYFQNPYTFGLPVYFFTALTTSAAAFAATFNSSAGDTAS